MKISYHAYLKRVSICEHILLAIIKSYSELHLDQKATFWGSEDSLELLTVKLRKLITFKSAFAVKLKGMASL
jgi:hypothetical protein